MNLLIIPSWYPTKNNPINGVFFRDQAIALAKYGYNVAVLNATFAGRKDIFSSETFRYIKKKYGQITEYSYIVPTFGLWRIKNISYLIFKNNMISLFKLIKKDLNIDIIHAHSYFPAGLASCYLGQEENIPVIITEHSTGIHNISKRPKELEYLKKTLELSTRFISVSENLKKEINEVTRNKKEIYVIPNMVSTIFFNYYIQKKKIRNSFIFISVGTLIPRKGFALLIDAFAKAFKGNKQIILNIIGEGPLKKELERKINAYDLNYQIHLLGALSSQKVAENISESDCFILTSEYETFGVVYIEAMAMGKPVIALRNGGANGIVNEFNGILLNEGKVDNIADAMIHMYKNAYKYDSKMIADYCYKKYSEAAICKQLSMIYSSAINNNNRASFKTPKMTEL